MGTVSLEGLEFFAYHGFYEEERRMGNKYSVDVCITTNFEDAALSDKLSETVNYEKIYQIVCDVMRVSAHLLEHIAHRIIEDIRTKYPAIEKVVVSVSKFNPPVGGVCQRAKVVLEG